MIRVRGAVIGCALALIGSIAFFLVWQFSRRDAPLPDAQVLLAEDLYDRAEAAARASFDGIRSRHGADSLQAANAAELLAKNLILNGRATSDETLAIVRNTLRVKEVALGNADPALAVSLFNLGDVLAERAEFEESIAVTERAVALREASVRPDSLEMAEAFDHLGAVLSTARRLDDGLKALERSLTIKEMLLGPTDVALASTLEDIGLVLQRKGEYEKSGTPLHRALALRKGADIEHPAYVRTLNLIAQQLWFEGQLIESKKMSEQAVDVAEHTLRSDHPTLALSIRYLAATMEDLGDLERSIALKKRALAIAERNFGANHHETAPFLHGLGAGEFKNGEYATARQHFQRALDIQEARYGPWHEYNAVTLSMMARAEASIGDYAAALRDQSRVVAIRERISPNHPFVAIALTDMASTYRQEGLPGQALPLLERALAIREKSLGFNHRDVAKTLAEMAATLQQVGKAKEAHAAATRAVGIWERLNAPNAPDYASALALYADLQARRGDDTAARDYYQKALAIRARVFGVSHPAYADTQAGLSLALARLGDREAALRNATSAETTGRDHLRTMLRTLPERQSLEYAAVRPRALDLMLSLTRSTPEAVDPAVDSVIRSRALVLDEMATRRRAQASSGATTDPRTAFSAAQQRLANLVVRGPGELSSEQYTALVEDARRESELAEQEFAQRSAEFRVEQSRARLGLDDVRASLPSDSALVSFVVFQRTSFAKPGPSEEHGPPSAPSVPFYLAFVIRPSQPIAVVDLSPARRIDSLVSQWRTAVAAEALGPTTSGESSASSRVSGTELRQLVWDPLAPHLGNANRVFIVPDGALSLVPFAALPTGKGTYLLERAAVLHYLSAERDLVPRSLGTHSSGHGLLALGGPAFDDSTVFGAGQDPTKSGITRSAPSTATRSSSPCENVQSMTFPSIKGTLQEVRELSSMWSTSATVSDEESRVLVGRDATEPTLKKDAHRYRVLHFATHGFFLSDSCPPAHAGTRAVGGLVNMSSPQYEAVTAQNPLLLSGLALAGANRRLAAGPSDDDGILTAEEVASLDLEGVEWAVLSACGTGLGQIRTGEGVFGLRRAFQIAGARTVIMSLWSVEDDATRLWMRALYEGRLKRNLNTADAMREASLSVLHARRAAGQSTHPFFWAAFVAAGDWR